MDSPRLHYRPLEPDDTEALHRLVIDEHVKRFLFDGEIMDRAWCAEAIAVSRRAFDSSGLGLWLVHPAEGRDVAGFSGFWVFEALGPDPQLLYAFTPEHCGQGYATEAARALVVTARQAGLEALQAAVDEPNQASIRVLEKVGFTRSGSAPGAFGRTLLFQLDP